MKKRVVQKTVAQIQGHLLSKYEIEKIKGGASDQKDDIVIVDVITP